MDTECRNNHKKSPRKPNENKQQPCVKTKKPPPPVAVPQQKPSLSRKNAGTNWSNGTIKESKNRRRKKDRLEVVAMDCEMVGTGPDGSISALARVSIVRKNGEVIMDKFVKPNEPVTDYRTSVSGIRAKDIEHGESFGKVQDEVIDILQGKILVGHALYNDLAVLHIKHPIVNIRDTARYRPLSRLVSKGRTPSLKRLSQAILGKEIQNGEHNSVEDARAAMNIYNRLSIEWEKDIEKKKRYNMMNS